MATRFELVLLGEDAYRMRAAGEEALSEIQSLEKRLSFYDPRSELSGINRLAARQRVSVAPDVFDLIRMAKELSEATEGSFDPTVAPLMRCWGFVRGAGHHPDEADLEAALRCTGMHNVSLDHKDKSIRFAEPGVEIDLGGIAKGYALHEAATLLRSAGIKNALLHGGTSTIVAMGMSFDETFWRVGIVRSDGSIPGTVDLSDCSLSVSALTGKSFTSDGVIRGHIIDPRTGMTAARAPVAAVVADSSTVSDALSTAVLVLGSGASVVSDYCTGWGIDSVSGDQRVFAQEGLPGFTQVS